MLTALPPGVVANVLRWLMPEDLARAACTCRGLRLASATPELWAAAAANAYDTHTDLSPRAFSVVAARAGDLLRKISIDAGLDTLLEVPLQSEARLEAIGYDLAYEHAESAMELEAVLGRFPSVRDVFTVVCAYNPPSALVLERCPRVRSISLEIETLSAVMAQWLLMEPARLGFMSEMNQPNPVAPEFTARLSALGAIAELSISDGSDADDDIFAPLEESLRASNLRIAHLEINAVTSWRPSFSRLLDSPLVEASEVEIWKFAPGGTIASLDSMCEALRSSTNLRLLNLDHVNRDYEQELARLYAAVEGKGVRVTGYVSPLEWADSMIVESSF